MKVTVNQLKRKTTCDQIATIVADLRARDAIAIPADFKTGRYRMSMTFELVPHNVFMAWAESYSAEIWFGNASASLAEILEATANDPESEFSLTAALSGSRFYKDIWEYIDRCNFTSEHDNVFGPIVDYSSGSLEDDVLVATLLFFQLYLEVSRASCLDWGFMGHSQVSMIADLTRKIITTAAAHALD